ncbi:MAG: FAD:protein FMN transferase [Ruminiclostridium sp.]|nr:FAD:protein FMN transferase [Ruminiclostridium sp.]
MRGRNRIYTAAAAALLLFAGACGAVREAEKSVFAMDTVVTVKAYGDRCGEAVNAAADRLTELERRLSATDADSDIGRLNAAGSAAVSGDTAEVVSRALELCGSTDGALDITIYPVVRAWGFTTGEYRVPSDDELAAALGMTGYGSVSVNGGTVSVPPGRMLDLGACAKGYASGEMLKAMSELGITSALVNIGGNVHALGSKPDGTDWTVGIADPFSPNELLGKLKISGCAVVTSGGYQRYFKDDAGNVYIHIIDPATGRPADSGLVSVTVIGGDGLLCDALSTALFVMGRERAEAYLRGHGGFDMILVTDGGVIAVTEGIADSFENVSGMPVEIIYE